MIPRSAGTCSRDDIKNRIYDKPWLFGLYITDIPGWMDCPGERMNMEYHFTVKGTLPGLNDYLKAERSFSKKHSCGNDMKQQYQMVISNAIRTQLKRLEIKNPVRIEYRFYEPNRKRDLDNIAGVAHKFIQDALVKCKVLENDGWNNITGFSDHFYIDRQNPRIDVTIIEVGGANEG